MDLLVAGAGQMGRWFAETTRSVVDDVAFADADPAVAEAAAEAVGGRAVEDPGEGAFDAVCIAVPIPAVEEAVATYAGAAERAIVDVTGVIGAAVDAMAEYAPELERASFHPLFAPERAPGNVAVVEPNPGPTTDALRAVLVDRGNDCFDVTAAEHDEAMSSVQGAVHAAVLAYGLVAEEVREEFHTPVSEGLADLLATVTGNEARVYADVQAAFDGAADVAAAARRIADADREEFAALYEAAGETAGADSPGSDRPDDRDACGGGPDR